MSQIIETPSLGLSEALSKATSNIFKFEGRSRRSEFWWTILIVYLVNIVLTPFAGFVLDILTIPLAFRRLHDTGRSGWWWGGCAILQGIMCLVLLFDLAIYFLKTISMMHDSYDVGSYEEYSYNGFFFPFMLKYLIFFVLILIYKIVLLVYYCTDSEPFENIYGESPKYVLKEEQEDAENMAI
jgi:uncharacterized membrane protein YhaH (DUF805 family)